MAAKKSFLESRGYKKGVSILYGIGAAVVILGALFKILHLPGATEMLIIGMGTEAFIFFVSAFNPLPPDEVHYHWEKVYPQLKEEDDLLSSLDDEDELDENGEPIAQPIAVGEGTAGAVGAGYGGAVVSGGGASPASESLVRTNQMLSENELTPEIFENLSKSLEALRFNVENLADLTDVTVATTEFSDKLRTASGKIDELNKGYSVTVDSMNEFGNSVNQVRSYQDQIALITKNLNALNSVYEQELADAQKHVNSISKFYGSMSSVMQNLLDTSKDTENLRQEVTSLTKNLRNLNGVYGGILSAMAGGSRA